MADSEPFQSFWFGDGLLPHQWLCMTSFIDYGHAYRLYSYEPITVPRGVECRDAREILPRERVFFYPRGAGAGSVAGFANLFRYKLLAEHGGWWVDTDVVCRKSIVSDAELVFAREQPHHICNAVLKLPRGHPLACQFFTEADRAGADLDWGETGPDLLTRAIEGSIYDRHVLPSAFCYPILGADAMQFLDPEQGAAVERKTSGSPLIHLWNEMWRRTGVDCFAAPPAGSFMAKLFEAHRLDFDETVKRILLLIVHLPKRPTYVLSCAMSCGSPRRDKRMLTACRMPSQPTTNDRDQGLNYSTLPLALESQFDFIFIDGRRRLECAFVATLLSHPDTIVVLHDYRRTRYQPMKALYEVIEDGSQFRVMRLRRDISVAEGRSIYPAHA